LKTGIKIAPFQLADIEKIPLIQPEDWPDIIPSLRFYCASDFCFPMKAVMGEEMVGIGTAIIYGETAWLAHIIVNRHYRNAGIGSTITKGLIDFISKTSCKTILLIATALGEPVYRKIGFEVQTAYVFFDEGSIPSSKDSTACNIFEISFVTEMLKLDRIVSGENRMKLLLPHLNQAQVFTDDGTVTGFYLPTLGEGLIIANNSTAGFELMKVRACTQKKFCIPIDNEPGIKFLQQYGCKEIRKASRMIYGRKTSFDGTKLYSRIGGNLG
jgi:hypothetical protein